MTLTVFSPPIPPSTGSTSRPKVTVQRADFGEGYSSITRTMNNIRDVLNLQWDALNATDTAAIIGFFTDRGGAEPFLYTAPGDAAPKKWIATEWGKTWQRGNLFSVTATLEQSFAIVS